jgi:hypothetical protein
MGLAVLKLRQMASVIMLCFTTAYEHPFFVLLFVLRLQATQSDDRFQVLMAVSMKMSL